MELYRNLDGNSNIQAFELGYGSITVRFNDGGLYTYTNASAGVTHIQQMQQLAIDGRGLNGYINRYTKFKYASKRRI